MARLENVGAEGVKLDMPERAWVKFITITVMAGVLFMAAVLESGQRNTGSGILVDSHADVTHLEKKIHDMINRERVKNGLHALIWNEGLHGIARKYSQDMAERTYFSHNDPEGRSFCDRYKAAGFDCRIRLGDTTCLGAENISQMRLTHSYIDTEDKIAESVVKGWMSSKSHRGNILTPYFRRQGIGVALSDDGKVYITENFC